MKLEEHVKELEKRVKKLEELLDSMVHEKEASDIFIVAGLPLSYKVSGQQKRTDGKQLMPPDTRELIETIYTMAGRDFGAFLDNGNHDEDFSFSIDELSRFRVNAFRQRNSLGAVIRVIPFGLPDPVAMHIPTDVLDQVRYQRGMVLVTGAAGSGKSTTLACMVDRLNHERTGHIVTMEDPIEYIHHHGTCIVTQREIPTDVATYGEALRSSLREAPDVLLLGEMRDQETMSTAVTAASSTVDRIIDTFPPTQQRQLRLQLSLVLRAIISQQLVPTKDGGIVPVFEIMVANTAIRNLIREEKSYQIDSVIAASGKEGMRTMDQSLFQLVKDGTVDKEVALQHAIHANALANRLQAAGL